MNPLTTHSVRDRNVPVEGRRGRSALDPAPPEVSGSIYIPFIQRRTLCACGGGCPACQDKSSDFRISKPNDPTEIEADQTADKVMRMPTAAPVDVKQHSTEPGKISAKCAECEEEEEKETVMRKEGFVSEAPPPDEDPPDDRFSAGRGVTASGGQPLDPATRGFFEPRLDADLGHVRIHTDSTAGLSARSLNARAYTLGNNIVFGSGEYRTDSEGGKHLLAHELAHTIQQQRSANRWIARQDAGASPTPAAAPAAAPPAAPAPAFLLARGQMYVSQTPDGVWYYYFSPEDYLSWGSSGPTKITAIHLNQAFTGMTSAVISELLSATTPRYLETQERINAEAEKGRPINFSIVPEFHRYILDWMAAHHPEIRPRTVPTGTQDLPPVASGIDTKPPVHPPPEPEPVKDPSAPATDRSIRQVREDDSVMENNPPLSLIYLLMMQHFTSLPMSESNLSLASDGLNKAELNVLIGKDPLRKVLTGYFTQGWNEFAAAGGSDPDAYAPLIERILEQFTRGNPNVTGNRLRIGHGYGREKDILGIVFRNTDELWYDDLGMPLKRLTAYRDHGYMGVDIPEAITRQAMESKKAPLTHREEMDLQTLNMFMQSLGAQDLAMVEQAAVTVKMKHINAIAARMREGLPQEILEALAETAGILSGFMVGHAFAAFAMKSPNPYIIGLGALVEVALKGAEYAMGISFLSDVEEVLVKAGFHVSRIRDDERGKPTALSEYHMDAAAEPIRQLIIATSVFMGGLAFAGAVRSATVRGAVLRWAKISGTAFMLGVAEAIPATRGTGGGPGIIGEPTRGATIVMEQAPRAPASTAPVVETAPVAEAAKPAPVEAAPVVEAAKPTTPETAPAVEAAKPATPEAAPAPETAAPSPIAVQAPAPAKPAAVVDMVRLGIPAEAVQILGAADFSKVELKYDEAQKINQDALYVLRDSDGSILKVGKTTALAAVGRFAVYRRALTLTGKNATLEVYPLKPTPKTAEAYEDILRKDMEKQGEAMPWDNTKQRLGRPGFGTPGEGVRTPPVTRGEMEELLILYQGDLSKVGADLGVHRRTADLWAKSYGLNPQSYKPPKPKK